MYKDMTKCQTCKDKRPTERKACPVCHGTEQFEALFEDFNSMSYVDDVWIAIGPFEVRRVSAYITVEGDMVAKFDSSARRMKTLDARVERVNRAQSGGNPSRAIIDKDAPPWKVVKWLYDMCKDVHKGAKVELMP